MLKGRTVLHLTMPETNPEIQQAILSGKTIINHPCALIRRSALQQIGGYDEAMQTVEDLDMLLRIGEIGLLANLPNPRAEIPLSHAVCQRQAQRFAVPNEPNCLSAGLAAARHCRRISGTAALVSSGSRSCVSAKFLGTIRLVGVQPRFSAHGTSVGI